MSMRTKKHTKSGKATFGFYKDDDTGLHSSAANTVSLKAGGTDVVVATSTQLQFPSGINLSFVDDSQLRFGTGDDVKVDWDGSKLVANSALNPLWADAPSPLDPNYHAIAFEFFDDFQYLAPVDANTVWVEVDDGSTGTNVIQDALGGLASVVTAASDNDYHAIRSAGQIFNLANTKELWFEARFKINEAATNESTWWFGLTDTLTTGGMQANTAGPLASYDGVLIWTQEGDLAILSETSNAGTQATNTTLGNYSSGTFVRVGFHVSAAATTAVVTFYSDLTDSGVMTAFGTTKNLTRSGLQEMHVIAGVKAGPSAGAETLEPDYVKVVQMR